MPLAPLRCGRLRLERRRRRGGHHGRLSLLVGRRCHRRGRTARTGSTAQGSSVVTGQPISELVTIDDIAAAGDTVSVSLSRPPTTAAPRSSTTCSCSRDLPFISRVDRPTIRAVERRPRTLNISFRRTPVAPVARPSVDPWSPESPCWPRGRSNLQAIIDAVAERAARRPRSSPSSPTRPTPAPSCAPSAPASRPSHVGRHAGEARADYDARLADVVAGVRPRPGGARRLDAHPHDELPRLVPRAGSSTSTRRCPASCPAPHAIERACAEARAGDAHAHRRDGPPRPRRGRRRRPGARPRPTCRSIPTTPSTTLTARVHAAEHDLLVDTLASLVPDRRSANDIAQQRRAVRPLRSPHVRRRGRSCPATPRRCPTPSTHAPRSPPTSRSPSRSCRRRWTRSPRPAWRSPWPATAASA